MTDTTGIKIVNDTFRIRLQATGATPEVPTNSPSDNDWLAVTPSDVASISAGVVVDGKTSFVEIAAHGTAAAKFNLAANVAIGSVDVVNAARNGTLSDVAIQSAGLATSLWVGAKAGAATTAGLAWAGPWVAIPAGIIVGGATAFVGEKAMEELLEQIREDVGRPKPPSDAITGSIQINNDGSETHTYPDPNTGWQVQTKVIVDPQTGAKAAIHTTVIDPKSPMRGMTYPVNAVKNGYELNALDRISEETHARAMIKKAQEERAAIERARADRDRQGGGSNDIGGSSAGGATYGGSNGTSSTATVNGTGYISGGGNYSTSTFGTGNATYTPVYDNHADRLGVPIVIDLDGDGVEFSPLGGSTARFDYDNDGYRELTAWVGKDDGLLVYDIGNDGKITETREVVIADWTADKTDTDLDARRAAYFNAGGLGQSANWNSRPCLRAAA